jgi:hypothetical protein
MPVLLIRYLRASLSVGVCYLTNCNEILQETHVTGGHSSGAHTRTDDGGNKIY